MKEKDDALTSWMALKMIKCTKMGSATKKLKTKTLRMNLKHIATLKTRKPAASSKLLQIKWLFSEPPK